VLGVDQETGGVSGDRCYARIRAVPAQAGSYPVAPDGTTENHGQRVAARQPLPRMDIDERLHRSTQLKRLDALRDELVEACRSAGYSDDDILAFVDEMAPPRMI